MGGQDGFRFTKSLLHLKGENGMRFGKKLVNSVLLSAGLMVFSFSSSSLAAPNVDQGSQKDIRVYIESNNPALVQKAKTDYGVRWNFDKGFSTTMNEAQFNALQKNKNFTVTKVEQMSIEAKPAPISPQAVEQVPWGIKAIYNDSTLTNPSGGSGIRIAVLDTGVNRNHTDLTKRVEQCKDYTTLYISETTCADRNGHGTHVAGTALADGGNGSGIYGVAPGASLWAYKVLNDRGSGYSDDIAAAIRRAADEGKRLGVKVVISMSLGSSANNSLISSAVSYAYSNGALVVAAAGNSGPNPGTIGYPGALTQAIAVAALENRQENGTYRVADFSSRGFSSTAGDYVIQQGDVEISAPGAAILSTWYNGGYNTISGTSMATPHVSGLAAKIWASNPSMTNAQLRANLQNRAKSYDIKGGYYSGTGDDIASGFGFARVR